MMNHPNPHDLPFELREAPDPARHPPLFPEPVASLLGEQLLVLQRIERSLETLMTQAHRQSTALEVIENIMDDVAYHTRNDDE